MVSIPLMNTFSGIQGCRFQTIRAWTARSLSVRMQRRSPQMFSGDFLLTDCLPSSEPEIGSTSSPVVESLRRFMRPAALNEFPTSAKPNATLNPVWHWHNYEDFTTPDGVDRLERLGVPATIEEYSMNAQLAQLFQYILRGHIHCTSYRFVTVLGSRV